MRKWLILILCLLSWPTYAQSTAEHTVPGIESVVSGWLKWAPLSTSTPLPVGVYDLGNHSGYCYTSNGSASPATFQTCGGGGGGGSSTLGTSVLVPAPYASGSDTQTGLYTAGSGKIDFTISGTQKLELTSSALNVIGNIGLGTTTAQYPIDMTATTIGTSMGISLLENSGITGTATGPTNLNLLSIGQGTSDNINAGANFVNGLTIQHYFGGSSMQGGREPVAVYGYLTAPTNASNPNRNYVTLTGAITAQSGDNGTSPSPKGAVFAFGANATAKSGATFLQDLTAAEFDVAAETGSSPWYKHGISVVGLATDAVQGYGYDAAIALTSVIGSVGWQNGILFGPMSSQQPMNSNGCLICTTGSSTVSKGIDLSSYTFTNSAIALPGPFLITNAGTLAIGTTATNGGVNIYSTADGAAFSWSDASHTGEWLLQEVNTDLTNRLRFYGYTAGEMMSFLTNGNVGVGDASPSKLFSVGGSSQFTVDGSGNVTATTGVAIGTTVQSGSINMYNTSDGAAATWSNNTLSPEWQLQEINSDSTHRMRMYGYRSSVEALSVLTSGFVGIGTPTPGYRFTVKHGGSGVAYFGSTGANNMQMVLDNVAGSNYDSILLNNAGAEKWEFGKDSANDFYLYNYGTSKNFLSDTPAGIVQLGEASGITVLAAGNVGIGSTSPKSKLDVAGTIDVNGTQIAASNLSNGTTGSGAIVLATSGALTSPALTTPTLGVATSTQIAIGTTTQSGTLNTYDTGDNATIGWSNNTHVPEWLMQQVMSDSTRRLRIYGFSGAGEMVTITTSGHVGIGTATPIGQFNVGNAAAHAGQATCWTTGGRIGYCTTVVSAGGACTCTGL